MDKKQLNELKLKAKAIRPIVRVGKAGLNKNIITEINKQLLHHKLIKIKLLKSSLTDTNKEDLISGITEETHSEIILIQGNIIALYKADMQKNKNINK